MAATVVRYHRRPALWNAMRVDAAFEVVCATACVFASGTFAAWTGLPVMFFVVVGIALYPIAALIMWGAAAESCVLARTVMRVNAFAAVAVALLLPVVAGTFAPEALTVMIALGLCFAALAAWEYVALRR